MTDKQLRKKYGLKRIDVHMGVFDFTVTVVLGSYEHLDKYVAWKFHDKKYIEIAKESNKGYEPRGKTFFRAGYCPIIWIPRKPKTPREHATLAHEALHAVYHLFDWVNLNANQETEEVMTHSMAHIINKVLETK